MLPSSSAASMRYHRGAVGSTRTSRLKRGALVDIIARDHTYEDVLSYVLKRGVAEIADFGSDDDAGPLSSQCSAETLVETLERVATRLLHDAECIVMPPLSSLVSQSTPKPTKDQTQATPVSSEAVRMSGSAAASRFVSPSVSDTTTRDDDKSSTVMPTATRADSRVANLSAETPRPLFRMSDVHREHHDDAVYYVATATLRTSIDLVFEGFAFVEKKRLLTDALLYGLSLMSRYPINPTTLEDETPRPIQEVMLQGIVQVLVNLDVLLDLQQYLNATRACRVCDLIRWCQATSRPQLVNVAAALSISLAYFTFPRLPPDISGSVSALKHGVDVLRRAYCGYDDCDEVCSDAERLKSPENFYALKDVMFLLDSVRRWFKKEIHQESSQHDPAATPLIPKLDGPATTTTNMAAPSTITAKSLDRYKQHPWMIGGAAKELHFVCTVPLRLLESWCSMSCDVDLRLMQSAGKARKQIEGSEAECRERLLCECAQEGSEILQRELWQCIEFRVHAEELDARKEIEMSYDASCENISMDLRRLLWHFQQYLRQFSTEALAVCSKDSPSLTPPKPFVPPRLYFLELVELHSIHSIELSYRDEIARQERYAFHALREAWNLDFQYLQEIMADEIKERALRAFHMQQLSLPSAEEADARKGFGVSRATSASLATWPYGDSVRMQVVVSSSSTAGLRNELVAGYPSAMQANTIDEAVDGWGRSGVVSVAPPLHGWTPGLIPSWAGSRAPTTTLPSAVPWMSTAALPGRLSTENYDGAPPQHQQVGWERFVPAAALQHRYTSPHSTTPSSLGLAPRMPRGVVMPLSGVTSPIPYVPIDECRSAAAAGNHHPAASLSTASRSPLLFPAVLRHQELRNTSAGGFDRPVSHLSRHAPGVEAIVVGTRVMSPDAARAAAGPRATSHGGDGSAAAAATQALLLHIQDLLDDEDIERALVEDEERTAIDRLRQTLAYRRVVALDWSMNGYLRATSRAAAAAPSASATSSRNHWQPSVSPRAPATPWSDARGGGGGRTSREDTQRHLPMHMRSVNSGRPSAGHATQLSPQPPSTPPQLQLAGRQQGFLARDGARADLCGGSVSAQPLLASEWDADFPVPVPSSSSRPVSRLLVDILVKGGTPIAPKYGSGGGSSVPVADFMPAVYRRRT